MLAIAHATNSNFIQLLPLEDAQSLYADLFACMNHTCETAQHINTINLNSWSGSAANKAKSQQKDIVNQYMSISMAFIDMMENAKNLVASVEMQGH